MILKYYEVCPRGFANEVTYIRVRPNEIPAVEKHFAGWVDRKYSQGDTHASCGWTKDIRARQRAIDWNDYVTGAY